jgi:hypothetical protein
LDREVRLGKGSKTEKTVIPLMRKGFSRDLGMSRPRGATGPKVQLNVGRRGPGSDSDDGIDSQMAEFEGALSEAEAMQSKVDSAMSDLGGDNSSNRGRLDDVLKRIDSQLEPFLSPKPASPPRSSNASTSADISRMKNQLYDEQEARARLRRELLQEQAANEKVSSENKTLRGQLSSSAGFGSGSDNTRRISDATPASPNDEERVRRYNQEKERADKKVESLEAELARMKAQMLFQGNPDAARDRAAQAKRDRANSMVRRSDDGPPAYGDIGTADRAVTDAELTVLSEAEGLRSMLISGLNEFVGEGDVPTLDWEDHVNANEITELERSLAERRKAESEHLQLRAAVVDQATENAGQLESLRKELMHMRRTVANYQNEEDKDKRQRLLDEAEARRRAMLAGVGYADLVQCRNFLNEFNSDEMLVRWAALRWSIIALGGATSRWYRVATRGSRSDDKRTRMIRAALGHWVNRKLSAAKNKWAEFTAQRLATLRLARRSLAYWLKQKLVKGFNTWRIATESALRGEEISID